MRITGGEGVDLIIDALGPTSFRKDYRLLRPGGRLVMYGLSEVDERKRSQPPGDAQRALRRCRWRRSPWWKSLLMMNENKGVFGLNMLNWWEREGNLDRVTEPLMADLEAGRLEPVVAEAFPFERRRRRARIHRRAPQRRQGRAVPIVGACPAIWPGAICDEEGDPDHAGDACGPAAPLARAAEPTFTRCCLAGGAELEHDPHLAHARRSQLRDRLGRPARSRRHRLRTPRRQPE